MMAVIKRLTVTSAVKDVEKSESSHFLGENVKRAATLENGLVAHACNPSYSGGRDQEDLSLRPAQANGSQDPISKIPEQNGLEVWLKAVECLLCKLSSNLNSNPNATHTKKVRHRVTYDIASPLLVYTQEK
jgi:hypothetical protein